MNSSVNYRLKQQPILELLAVYYAPVAVCYIYTSARTCRRARAHVPGHQLARRP